MTDPIDLMCSIYTSRITQKRISPYIAPLRLEVAIMVAVQITPPGGQTFLNGHHNSQDNVKGSSQLIIVLLDPRVGSFKSSSVRPSVRQSVSHKSYHISTLRIS